MRGLYAGHYKTLVREIRGESSTECEANYG